MPPGHPSKNDGQNTRLHSTAISMGQGIPNGRFAAEISFSKADRLIIGQHEKNSFFLLKLFDFGLNAWYVHYETRVNVRCIAFHRTPTCSPSSLGP